MDVLITGGTGFIGRHLCQGLIDRGHGVTALSRDPDPSLVPDEVHTVAEDVTDYSGLEETISGHDAVVNLVSPSPLFQPRGGSRTYELVHVEGTRNIVRAMSATGVDRLVQQSGLGADTSGKTAYIRAKGRAEGIVRASDLDWTITRPSVIFGPGEEFIPFVRLLTTPYVTGLPGGGHTRFQPIWIGDFVSAMATILEDDGHVAATYNIGGPQVLTLADVTRIVYRAQGKSVRIIPIPMPLIRLVLTISGWLPFIPFGSDQYRGLQFDNTTDENDVSGLLDSPDSLRTLEAYLADQSAPES